MSARIAKPKGMVPITPHAETATAQCNARGSANNVAWCCSCRWSGRRSRPCRRNAFSLTKLVRSLNASRAYQTTMGRTGAHHLGMNIPGSAGEGRAKPTWSLRGAHAAEVNRERVHLAG